MPDLSVIVPVYNRGELIRYTLESIRRASVGLDVELVVVDDGSTVPVTDSITALYAGPTRIVRQENQGLLFARLTGLRHATGTFTVFLDSDDLVGEEKFRLQLMAMADTGADVSYSDTARTILVGEYESLSFVADQAAPRTCDGPEFFITVQPAPHSPIFRTDFLRRVVEQAYFPPSPLYNPVAEIWFYHNAAPLPSVAVKVDGPHTIIGSHGGERLTNRWERLAVASLAVQEAFARTCPRDTPIGRQARQLVAAKAFGAWRRLPHDFSPEFSDRLLNLCRLAPERPPAAALGGPCFRIAAALLGATNAGRLFRLRNASYASCRTLDDSTLADMMAPLPPP
jgi:hypothetical protein